VLLAAVVEDLRAWAARARLGGLPEVVLAQAHDALRRNPDALPGLDRNRVLAELQRRIALVHGRPQPFGIELHVLGDELPGELDCPVLEVVAEREVAEHLEERAVTVGAADIFEIGVLAPGAQHFLDADHPFARGLPKPEEVRLELLHPRDDEERRRVVRRRDQRMRGHAQVALLLEEALETFSQFCCGPHRDSLGLGGELFLCANCLIMLAAAYADGRAACGRAS